MAKEIKKLEKLGNISVFRYGGDEFVILYEGYELENVWSIAEGLKAAIAGLSMQQYREGFSAVTISQGICWDIPQKVNKVWDFLHLADASLYKVKENYRNGIAVCRCNTDETRGENGG